MATSNVFETSEIIQLREIEEQRRQIQSALELVTLPELRSAYEEALHKLGERTTSLALDQGLQVNMATYGFEALEGLEQLSPLRGVLNDERLAELEGGLTERIASVRGFFERYGVTADRAREFMITTPEGLAVVATTEIEPVPVASPTPEKSVQLPERLASPRELTITVGLNMVRIGQSNRSVDYSLIRGHREDQRNYTEERRRALIKMLSLAEGETISARELFGVAFGPDEEFESNKLAAVRDWFGNLTYYNDYLIQYTRRGEYFINPKYKPVVKFGRKFQAWSERAEQEGIPQQVAEAAPAPELVEPKEACPSDFYLMAMALERFNFVLKDARIGEITPEILRGLEQYQPNLSAIGNNDIAKLEYRYRAYARVIDLIESRDAFFEYSDNLDPSSPEYAFVEFLYTLDEHQRDLVDLLIHARLVVNEVERGQVVPLATPRVETPDGDVIYPFAPTDRFRQAYGGEKVARGPEVEEIPASFEPDAAEAPTLELVPDVAEDEKAFVENESTINPERKSKHQQIMEAVETIARDSLDTLLGTSLDPTKQYRREVIEAATGFLRRKDVANARENNVGPKKKIGASFTLYDTLIIQLYSNRDIKPHFSRIRHDVERLVKALVETTLEEREARTQTA